MSQWMIPAHKLDDDQKQFLFENMQKPTNFWIKGFPGSGKSVLMVHALADIKKREPNAHILITYYTHSLRNLYQAGMQELAIDLRNVEFKTYFGFMKEPQNYDYIFCDEVQDLPENALSALRNNCRRLLIAGDPNQSIYDHTIHPDRIPETSNCVAYPLRIIHRLTSSVINLVNRILPDMSIFHSLIDTNKPDVTTRLGDFAGKEEEVRYVMDQAITAIDVDQSAAILLPTHNDVLEFVEIYCQQNNHANWDRINNQYGKPNYDSMNQHVSTLRLHYVGNSYGSLNGHNSVLLMTYHSAKGLDFDNVFLPFLNTEADIRGKSVFMVALTRSKNALTITYSDDLHPYVEPMEDLCHRLTAPNESNTNNNFWDFDF